MSICQSSHSHTCIIIVLYMYRVNSYFSQKIKKMLLQSTWGASNKPSSATLHQNQAKLFEPKINSKFQYAINQEGSVHCT